MGLGLTGLRLMGLVWALRLRGSGFRGLRVQDLGVWRFSGLLGGAFKAFEKY